MDKTFVIFNPAARGEKSRRLWRFLESQTAANSALTLAATTNPNHAQDLAAQAVAAGFRTVIAAGGDGTINEVVNGFGASGATLGILPLGTANVFARELRIPQNIRAAWATIEAGHTRAVDLGCAQATGQRRHFVQLAGVGFDAAAVRAADWKLKKRIGPLSYVWAGFKALRESRAPVEVLVDGAVRARGFAVLVGNGRLYGGWFRVFPEARPDDGRLDICVFENSRYLDLCRYTQAVIRGAHTGLRDVHYFQAERFECRAATPAPFELDGELAGDGPVQFSVKPRALCVLAP
jgi:YegS/Rv2252/BmrU family lipid kinase